MDFDLWMNEVDAEISRIAYVGVHDLSDWQYRDAFNDGLSPYEAAVEVLRDNDFPIDELE